MGEIIDVLDVAGAKRNSKIVEQAVEICQNSEDVAVEGNTYRGVGTWEGVLKTSTTFINITYVLLHYLSVVKNDLKSKKNICFGQIRSIGVSSEIFSGSVFKARKDTKITAKSA